MTIFQLCKEIIKVQLRETHSMCEYANYVQGIVRYFVMLRTTLPSSSIPSPSFPLPSTVQDSLHLSLPPFPFSTIRGSACNTLPFLLNHSRPNRGFSSSLFFFILFLDLFFIVKLKFLCFSFYIFFIFNITQVYKSNENI